MATELEKLKKKYEDLKKRSDRAYERLMFMKSHGNIGPDSAGNPECSRCMNALKAAITAIRPDR